MTTLSPTELFSKRFYRYFSRYLKWYFSRNFSTVRVLSPPQMAGLENQPLIVYCNHSSWWDAIMMHLLTSLLLIGREPYAPMDETALEHYRFFKRLGMFGVDQNTRRGAARFLRNSRDILKHSGTCLWLTPQGAFADTRHRPLQFKPGLAHLAKDRTAVLMPLALEYTFWEERKPEALASFGSPVHTCDLSDLSVEEWNEQLAARLQEVMDELAKASVSRDPGRFETLVDGSAGVNPAYDGWQRIKAQASGRRYSRRHKDIGS